MDTSIPIALDDVMISQALGILISALVSKLKRITFVATYPKVVAAILSLIAAQILHFAGDESGGVMALMIYFVQQLAIAIGGYEIAKTAGNRLGDQNRITRRLTVIFVLFAVCLSQTACNKDQLRRAANTSAMTASLVRVAIDTKRALAKDGTLDRDEELAITVAMRDLNLAVIEFNSLARTYDEFTAETRAQLLTLFNNVTLGVARLNDQGVLRIKNPQARGRFQKILTRVRAATEVASIWASLKKIEPKDRDPKAVTEAAQLFEQAAVTLDQNAARLAEDLARLQHREVGI